jgi:hypothetical protein
MSQVAKSQTPSSRWKQLYKIGGVAALIAGVLFRRNIAAEVELFSNQPPPETVSGWFEVLQNHRILGLTYLHIFDILNYLLVGLMILTLYVAFRRVNKGCMAIAATSGIVGITVYFASNAAFSMLSLSDQYAGATTESQRNVLLSAGEALLAASRFSSPGAHPGTGGYISLLLIAISGMIYSLAMFRSGAFKRTTAIVGMLANGLDLAYCVSFVFLPMVETGILAVIFIPAAGLLFMIWHIMVGWRLYKLGV